MFKNYLKIAWRNILRSKISSFINIGGLAVGMAVAILIGLWAYDELSFNKYHKNYERIAKLMWHVTSNGSIHTDDPMPVPIGKELQTRYGGDFKYVVKATYTYNFILSYGDKKLSRKGAYMEKEAPEMLTLKMLKGTRKELKDPNSILLAASTSKEIFDHEDPLGKLVRMDNKQVVKVSGVYEDLPVSSNFHDLKFIASWDLHVSSDSNLNNALKKNDWEYFDGVVYVQLADHANLNSVGKKIINVFYDNGSPRIKNHKTQIILHPMSDWHLRNNWDDNGNKTGGLIEYVWLFSIVGIFVLMLACINFMNLSTARSEKRAKEVGIRKTIGSLRRQLVGQFYSESLLVVVFAFLLAILLVELSLPWFNGVAGKKMLIPWSNPICWLATIGFILITGFVAGSYPALYLSAFQPLKVLKGTFRVGRFGAIPRKVLVVLQFTISLALIIGTIIVNNQVQYAKNRPIGYNRDRLITVEMTTPDFQGKFDMLRTDLKNAGAIEELAESNSPLTQVGAKDEGYQWDGKDPNQIAWFQIFWVTHEFGKTVGWQLKEGRDWSRKFATDSSSIIINEAAVKFMGIKDPVGKMIKKDDRTYRIVGVIKDIVMLSPYDPVTQTIFFLDYKNPWTITIKLNPNKSSHECLSKIEAVFKKYIPSVPFEFKFVDSEYAAKFAMEERIGTISILFAILAIFISCLGLFGLASFVAEQRTKEIGIRKVLGATVANLWRMLSKDFVVLVIISCFIATPLALYFMQNWLLKYEYHTDISGWSFIIAVAGVMVITLLTVSYQAIKAAVANPVKSLRSE